MGILRSMLRTPNLAYVKFGVEVQGYELVFGSGKGIGSG